jgi:hypothetical protein
MRREKLVDESRRRNLIEAQKRRPATCMRDFRIYFQGPTTTLVSVIALVRESLDMICPCGISVCRGKFDTAWAFAPIPSETEYRIPAT